VAGAADRRVHHRAASGLPSKDRRLDRLSSLESGWRGIQDSSSLATRRTRREREQLRDADVVARRAQFANIGRKRQITALLSDDEYAQFQSRLAANPGLGAPIKGGGGIRKIRVAVGSRGQRGAPASFTTGQSEKT
jgi:hypothetical protein